MSEWLCYNCFHYGGLKKNDWIVCNRIMPCYVEPKTECKYFKPINRGDKVTK